MFKFLLTNCRPTERFGHSTESERNAVDGLGWRESVARRSLTHGVSPFRSILTEKAVE